MRDVTDNVTGELDVVVKRGRGRPRKEGALTNAQRQAAYRARQRAGVVVEYGITGAGVTKKITKNASASRLVVDQVDAYDECRLEVEQLRADLADANKVMGSLQRGHAAGLLNEGRLRRQIELAEAERSKAFAAVDKLLAELAVAKKEAAKSVTSAGNVNAQQFEALLSLLDEACKVRRSESVARIVKAPAWPELVAGDLALSEGLREDLERAVMGQTSSEILAGWEKEETVTRKAVTKK